MKRFILYTIVLMASLVSSGSFAATVIDTGISADSGESSTPESYSGLFTDVIHYDVDVPVLLLNFSGSHTGMALDDLLLTNTNDASQYHLGKVFSETLSLTKGSYVFTISGFALNALNSEIFSTYELDIKAVPLPAAVWLFASALIGFISFSVRRKI
jgi:hypothetical protein